MNSFEERTGTAGEVFQYLDPEQTQQMTAGLHAIFNSSEFREWIVHVEFNVLHIDTEEAIKSVRLRSTIEKYLKDKHPLIAADYHKLRRIGDYFLSLPEFHDYAFPTGLETIRLVGKEIRAAFVKAFAELRTDVKETVQMLLGRDSSETHE